ncbi:MAG TPA: UvrD-helicase domain-containing protein [Polyangiaceae bacterium]|nr:UvrD-helicase domain-containing protein [Polyangiaceae bacterium]
MGTLTVVRAGAGSGKTYSLCETISERVVQGLDPARIVATTFTTKAAAELKGRIQQRLLNAEELTATQRLEKAERLELAVIGTVHSVGHQLLTRYALQMGLSPRLDVLDEAGSARALQDLLGTTGAERWEELAGLTHRMSLEDPQDIVLELLNAARSNRIGIEELRAHMQASADRVCQLMAPEGAEEDSFGFDELYDLIRKTLAQMDRIQDATKGTAEAKSKLRGMASRRSGKWKDFLDAGKTKATKASDSALGPLRAKAVGVLKMPALHADVRRLLGLLTERVVELSTEYQAFKKSRGLVDFTDMEELLLTLLESPELTDSLTHEFDLVVVDEFQDTNPLQLAIFQRLRAVGASSRWVGDAKQSIYGFRGTDPELVSAVWEAVPTRDRSVLPKNYRSQAGLVQFVGKVFLEAFGEEAALTPVRTGMERGIERWILDASKAGERDLALALGIWRLNQEDHIALRDIAVLTRSNAHAGAIGEACSAIGIPALLDLPGLLDTRECALVVAGLRLVADRHDSLAAAQLLHILGDPQEKTPKWLEQRLSALLGEEKKAPFAGEQSLGRLEQFSQNALSPSVIVQRVIDALEVGNHVRAWGEAARRLANLDSLVAVAQGYEEELRSRGGAATLSGMLSYLADLAEEGGDTARPPYGIDAVTILTYHRSKGLEWPVVILCDLQFERGPDMWSPVVEGEKIDADNPLSGRKLRYWPWPFDTNQMNGGLTQGTGLEDKALETPEGKRASKRQFAESLRLMYVGMTRARDKLVFAHQEGKTAWLSMLPQADVLASTEAGEGEHRIKGLETSYVLKRIKPPLVDQLDLEKAGKQRWQSLIERPQEAPEHPDRFASPSQAEKVPAAIVAKEPMPGGRFTVPKLDKEEDEPALLGDAVHMYLGSLPSHGGLPRSDLIAIAERCLIGFGAETFLSASDLVRMGERFSEWVKARHPKATWRTEVPLCGPRTDGGQWYGAADLLLFLSETEVVLVDHKSGGKQNALKYSGQVEAYRAALEGQGLKVKESWLHYPVVGEMVEVGGS